MSQCRLDLIINNPTTSLYQIRKVWLYYVCNNLTTQNFVLGPEEGKIGQAIEVATIYMALPERGVSVQCPKHTLQSANHEHSRGVWGHENTSSFKLLCQQQ